MCETIYQCSIIFFLLLLWTSGHKINASDLQHLESRLYEQRLGRFGLRYVNNTSEILVINSIDVRGTFERLDQLYSTMPAYDQMLKRIIELRDIACEKIDPIFTNLTVRSDAGAEKNFFLGLDANEKTHHIEQWLRRIKNIINLCEFHRQSFFYRLAFRAKHRLRNRCSNNISAQKELFNLIKITTRTVNRGAIIIFLIENPSRTLESVVNIDEISSLGWSNSTWKNFITTVKASLKVAPGDVCTANLPQPFQELTALELKHALEYKEVESVEDDYYNDCIDNCNYMSNDPNYTNCRINERSCQPPPDECFKCTCYCTPGIYAPGVIQAISLMEQTSDTKRNKVITGVKFVMQGDMIQIQIKQGVLQPEGLILNGSESWKSLDEIEQFPDGFYNHKKGFMLVKDVHFAHVTLSNNVMSLRDIRVPPSLVITGVGFVYEKDPRPDRYYFPMAIRIGVTTFNPVTGQLHPGTLSIRQEYDPDGVRVLRKKMYDHDSGRKEIEIEVRDTNKLATREYVEFINGERRQGIETKTLKKRRRRQAENKKTTVPFFDSQPVESYPPSALGAIGLVLKGGNSRTGGYLAMRIATYNFSHYIGKVDSGN